MAAKSRPAWLRAIVNDVDVEPRNANVNVNINTNTNININGSITANKLPPYKPDLQCKHCKKLFRRVCNYREHQRIHSNEYKFTCRIPGCGRRFLWRSSIQAHVRSHEAKLRKSRAKMNSAIGIGIAKNSNCSNNNNQFVHIPSVAAQNNATNQRRDQHLTHTRRNNNNSTTYPRNADDIR